MENEATTRLLNILLGSLFSFINAGLYLLELYIVLLFVRELKLEPIFKKVTNLIRFILALIVTSLAFPAVNSSLSRYISGLIGQGAPLSKILLLVEAAVFFYVLHLLYKGRVGSLTKDGEEKI